MVSDTAWRTYRVSVSTLCQVRTNFERGGW